MQTRRTQSVSSRWGESILVWAAVGRHDHSRLGGGSENLQPKIKNPIQIPYKKKLLGNQILTWCLIELSVSIMDMQSSHVHVTDSPVKKIFWLWIFTTFVHTCTDLNREDAYEDDFFESQLCTAVNLWVVLLFLSNCWSSDVFEMVQCLLELSVCKVVDKKRGEQVEKWRL